MRILVTDREQWPSGSVAGFPIQGSRFKTNGCRLSLSFLRGQSNEYQGTPRDVVVKSKLSPLSGTVALRHLNPIHKEGP